MKNDKMKSLSIEDLVSYEKATRSVMMRYENMIKRYDGAIVTEGNDYVQYDRFNKIYQAILSEMENRILDL